MYQHKEMGGHGIDLPVGKVICVGRNYLDHINEMSASLPEHPLLFIKPSTALVSLENPVEIPTKWGECHNELEVAVLVKSLMKNIAPDDALKGCWGIGLGLDLTLRDVQAQLKRDGYPWERAKAFDGSCPMGHFVPMHKIANINDISFSLVVNQKIRQQGNSRMMCWPLPELIAAMSEVFTLLPGDIIMTGTPKGVGPLYTDDTLTLSLNGEYQITTKVTAQ